MVKVVTFDFGGKFAPGNYEDLLRTIDKLPPGTVVLGCREEDCSPKEHYTRILELQNYIHCRGLKFCVLFNWFTQLTNEQMPGIDVDYIDFMLLKTVYHNPTPASSGTGSGILFLMGKPDRMHRAPLLYKFFQNNQLSQLTWSFFVPNALESAVRELVPQATDTQWQQFLALQQSPDHATFLTNNNSIHVANYAVTNPELFSATAVSLVSESMFDDPGAVARLTEKTYKAIDNKHAFVIAGPPGTLSMAKTLGYRCFEQYLPWPGYDSELDPARRLQMVYENILALNDAVATSNAIAKDIQHNYTVNRQRYQQQLDRVLAMLSKYGYQDSALKVIMLHDQLAPNNLTERYMQVDNQ